jgi:peptide/nickel transport system substrate-binding protein
MVNRFPTALFVALIVCSSLFVFSSAVGAQSSLPRTQTLYLVNDEGPITSTTLFNPFLPATPQSDGFREIAMEYLFYYNVENNSLVPWLATGYNFSNNYRTLTIYIRKGVTWSDGYPFTAQDVAFTINMLKRYATATLLFSLEVNSSIEDAVAANNYTVTMNLTQPNPHIIYQIFAASIGEGLPIVPEHIWQGKNPLNFTNDPPVFTGPYKLVTISGTEAVWQLRKSWWATKVFGIKPAPEYIVYEYLGTTQNEILAMAHGQLDAINDLTYSDYLSLLTLDKNIVTWHENPPYSFVDPCPRYISLNLAKYPWNITQVRWALSLAINRSQVIQYAYHGTTTVDPFLMPSYPSFRPYFQASKGLLAQYNTTEYNSSQAAQLLESQGFKMGSNGIWMTPQGEPLQATLITISSFPEFVQLASAVSIQLQNFGVDVSVKNLQFGPWLDALFSGQFDIAVNFMCSSQNDPYTYLYTVEESWPNAPSNFTDYVNQLASIPPQETQEAMPYFLNATQVWLQQLPMIPLVNAEKLPVFSSSYWTGWPTARDPYGSPEFWLPAFLFTLLHLTPVNVSTSTPTTMSTTSVPTTSVPTTPTTTVTTGVSAVTVIIGVIVAVIVVALVAYLVRRRHA